MLILNVHPQNQVLIPLNNVNFSTKEKTEPDPPQLNFLTEAPLSPGEIFHPFAHHWKKLLGSYAVGTNIVMGRIACAEQQEEIVQMYSHLFVL